MKHIMVDNETWGVKPYSTIISIGAVLFDPSRWARSKIQQSYYITIDPVASEKAGFRKDADTIAWWLQPSQAEAWKDWYETVHAEPHNAFLGLAMWIESLFDEKMYPGALANVKVGDRDTFNPYDHVCLWGNGAGFDNVLLRQGFELLNIEPPWRHYNDRCFRTLKNLVMTRDGGERPDQTITAGKCAPPFEGTKHNALADAIHQAKWLCNIAEEFELDL